MKCPNCNHFIPPYKVWLISRWTFIKCNNCEKLFGRKVNLQLLVIGGLLFAGWVVPFHYLTSLTRIDIIYAYVIAFLICVVFWAPFVMLADAATIHLVPTDKNDQESQIN